MDRILAMFFYNSKRWLKLFVQSKPLALIVGPILTGYFAILDVWGTEWRVITEYKDFHQVVFIFLLAFSLIFWIIRASLKDEIDDETRIALETINEFVLHIGLIVEKKINRFMSKIPMSAVGCDKFSLITLPEDQLDVILQEASSFLIKTFKIKHDCINVCVIEKVKDKWKILRKLQRWSYTPRLLKGHNDSLEIGEPSFYPSKKDAVKDSLIEWSSRDTRRMKGKPKYDGSLYIFPMNIQISDKEEKKYLVSISTYEKKLCETFDIQSIEVTKRFLREFCRRIEVELCLHTLKGGLK